MKITANYTNTYPSYSPGGYKSNSTPSFGISFKPKILKDIFTKNTPLHGVSKIKNVHAGKFGTVCKGSKPLKNFEDRIGTKELEKLYKKGLSTNTDGWANCFLKSKADRPLSTSSVYDCSVMYLFNEKTNTHFLYHSYFDTTENTFDYLIKTFMPEGFTKANLVTGYAKWYPKHGETLTQMLKALKTNTQNAEVNIYHYNSELPEIVGYKGNVFEIPNIRTKLGFSDKGQASFEICDLQIDKLTSELNERGTSTQNIKTLRKIYAKLAYDKEILKVFNKLLDERAGKIKEMESCKTIEELNSLINSYPQNERLKYFNAMESQRNRILLDQFFHK